MNTDQHCAYVTRESKHKCQFEEAHDFIEFDGKPWCRFHLPMRDGQGNDSSKAIWDGPTIEAFNHAIFDLIGNAKTQNTKADFEGVVFPGAISVEQFTADNLLPEVSFFRAAFGGHADFHGAAFNGNADFHGATFSGDASFQWATFNGDAWFSEATFSGNASFSEATFRGNPWFSEATFSGQADFRGATFSGNASFSEATFSGNPGFSEAAFNGNADFHGATFNGNAWFSEATFSGEDVWFHEATFNGDAWFSGATFNGDAWFGGATFSGNADFSCSPNRPGPSPKKNLQHDSFASVSFENAKFNGRAIFTNRKFTHPADFSGGHFKLTPEFYGCLLHQGTTFLGRKFLDRGKENAGAVMAYRTLKLAMESVRDRTNEAMFFAYEQEAMRKTKQAPPLVRLLSFLYAISSRYGQSIGLPLFWLGITTFIAFLVYAYLQYGVSITDWSHLLSEAYLRKSDALKKFWDILRASLEPIFKPLRILNSEDLSYRPRVQLLMLLQSLLSLIWVALFLLAVRRRFKLD